MGSVGGGSQSARCRRHHRLAAVKSTSLRFLNLVSSDLRSWMAPPRHIPDIVYSQALLKSNKHGICQVCTESIANSICVTVMNRLLTTWTSSGWARVQFGCSFFHLILDFSCPGLSISVVHPTPACYSKVVRNADGWLLALDATSAEPNRHMLLRRSGICIDPLHHSRSHTKAAYLYVSIRTTFGNRTTNIYPWGKEISASLGFSMTTLRKVLSDAMLSIYICALDITSVLSSSLRMVGGVQFLSLPFQLSTFNLWRLVERQRPWVGGIFL